MSNPHSAEVRPGSTANNEKSPSLSVRRIDAEERLDDVLSLLQTSMASGAERWSKRELWQWKHLSNPFGRSLVLISEADDGRLAGLRAFMKWRLRDGDRLVEAYRPVDTATHPDFRRKGIFSTLTLQAIEHARESGVELIFNTPNSMSVAGYLKMGWKQSGVATPLLKVNGYPSVALKFARRKIGRKLGFSTHAQESEIALPENIRPEVVLTSEIEPLIDQYLETKKGKLATDYSVDYLRWRYADNPLYRYAVISDSEAGTITSACIVRMAHGPTLNTLIFEDFLLGAPGKKQVTHLVDMAIEAFKPDLSSAFSPPDSDLARDLRSTGFRFNSRSRVNFVVNPLQELTAPPPEVFSNWALGMSELEIF